MGCGRRAPGSRRAPSAAAGAAEAAAAGAGSACTSPPSSRSWRRCDLVIEAAPEDLEIKRGLFAELSRVCGPDAVLATNTSSLPVTALATAAERPERVVGMHFFNPVALMDLLEVVAGTESSPEAIEIAAAAGERMGKRVILARDGPGFLANRCARPFGLEALKLLAEGVATHEQIDRDRADGRRLSHGPVRADGPRRDRRRLRGDEVLLGAELPRAALAAEHDPGAHGRRPAAWAARRAAGTTTIPASRHRPEDPEPAPGRRRRRRSSRSQASRLSPTTCASWPRQAGYDVRMRPSSNAMTRRTSSSTPPSAARRSKARRRSTTPTRWSCCCASTAASPSSTCTAARSASTPCRRSRSHGSSS